MVVWGDFFLLLSFFVYILIYSYHPLSLSSSSQYGNLPIHIASQRGHLEVVHVLLECDPSTVSVQNRVSLIYIWYCYDGRVGWLFRPSLLGFVFLPNLLILLFSLFFNFLVWNSSHPLRCQQPLSGNGSCSIRVWSFHCICSREGKLIYIWYCFDGFEVTLSMVLSLFFACFSFLINRLLFIHHVTSEWPPSHPLCCHNGSSGSGSCSIGVWSFHCIC